MRAMIVIALLAVSPAAFAQGVVTPDNFGCLAFGSVEDRAHYRVLTLVEELEANEGRFWDTAVAEYASVELDRIQWPADSYTTHLTIKVNAEAFIDVLMVASDWHGVGKAPLVAKNPQRYSRWQGDAEQSVGHFVQWAKLAYSDAGLTCARRTTTAATTPEPTPVADVPDFPDVDRTGETPIELEEPYEAPTALAIKAMLQDAADDPRAMIEIMTHPEHQRVLREGHSLKPALRFLVDNTIDREAERLGALKTAGQDFPEQYAASAKSLDGVRFLCIKFGYDYRRADLDTGIELMRQKAAE